MSIYSKVAKRGESGFSLVEAMIAFAIVALGLLAITQFQTAVLQANSVSRSRSEALHLAEEKIESFRSIRNEADFAAKLGVAVTGTEETVRAYAKYQVSWEIVPRTDPDRAIVAVEVSWIDADGYEQKVNLVTEIAETNPHKVGRLL